MTISIRIQNENFDATQELRALTEGQTQIGASCSFVGYVRDNASRSLQNLFIEHYPGMTETAIQRTLEQAQQRWKLLAVQVIHRVGHLNLGEQIVWVAVAAAHRHTAFEACAFLMDFLKTEAPFWKQEIGREGTHWVEVRAEDVEAAQGWNKT